MLKALDGILVVLALGLPFYWQAMTEGLEGIDAASLLVNIRAAQIELSDQSRSVSLVLNLNVLAQFTAIALFYEADSSFRRRWRAALGVALALVYGAMSGTKGNAVTLLLTLAFVSSIRAQRIQPKVMAIIGAAALLIFSTGILLVNLAAPEIVDTGETANVVAEQVVVYWLGGLVAFGDIAANPNGIVSTAPIDRFFLESARTLGMAVEVPPKHADYTMVSPVLDTNVYTAYFTYFKDPGWVGMVLIMCMLGAALTVTLSRGYAPRPGCLTPLRNAERWTGSEYRMGGLLHGPQSAHQVCVVPAVHLSRPASLGDAPTGDPERRPRLTPIVAAASIYRDSTRNNTWNEEASSRLPVQRERWWRPREQAMRSPRTPINQPLTWNWCEPPARLPPGHLLIASRR